MEIRKFKRALIQFNEYKGKTNITVLTNTPLIGNRFWGEMAEDVVVETDGETVKLSFKVGRWVKNEVWYDDDLHVLKSSIKVDEVVEQDTEMTKVRDEIRRIFRKNLPPVFKVLPKRGYVELRNPNIANVQHIITNFHLIIDEKQYEPSK